MTRILLIKLIAVLLIIFTLIMALPYKASTSEKKDLAQQFSFKEYRVKKVIGKEKTHRKVHPQYKDIVGWLSSSGAAVAIGDLDNDGFENEYVVVDPRFDKVIIHSFKKENKDSKNTILDVRKLRYDEKTMAPQGTLIDDFNEDGLTDILVYYWGRTPIIFLSKGNGEFDEIELYDKEERWFTLAATLSDFDGDGHTDILITNYFPDGSRLLDENAKDSDQTMQHSMSRARNGGTNHFFLFDKLKNNIPLFKKDTNWVKTIKYPNDWTLAVGAIDMNNDGLPEVYLANDFGPDKLLLNKSTPGKLSFIEIKGKRNFNSPSSSVLGYDSFKGMGVGFADINKDGLFDIYVSNIADEFALMESHFVFINTGDVKNFNKGIAPFKNQSDQLGLARSSWGWDSKFADFNNDGEYEAIQATGFLKGKTNKWPELQELAMGNDELLAKPYVWPKFGLDADLSGNKHNPFFVKGKNERYIDLSRQIGIDRHQVTRGIAIGDMDYDGDLDFIYANQWDDSFVYENTYKGPNSFLGLRIFKGSGPTNKVYINPKFLKSKTYAIGAIVKVFNEKNELLGINYVDGGSGHSGKNSHDVFFGLNQIEKKEKLRLEIYYRNKKNKLIQQNIKINQGWNTILLPY